MKNQNQSFLNLNEIVFEHRNKAYGAYVIRNSYNAGVTLSLFISTALFTLATIIAVLTTNKHLPKLNGKDVSIINDSALVVEFKIPEKAIIEKVVEKKPISEKPHTDNLNFKASDKKVDEIKKTNDEIKIVSNSGEKGKDSTTADNHPIVVVGNTLPPEDKEAHSIVQVMPEFPGNLFQYLKDNLRYPRMAVENVTSGIVYLTFVVEKSGEIGDIKVLKPVPDGCTEEAIRVVKGMPKWKPGKNNGELKRVQFNLPVKFTIRE